MSSKWELKEKSTGELVATVEGEDWKQAQKKAFNKIKKNINIPGSVSYTHLRAHET